MTGLADAGADHAGRDRCGERARRAARRRRRGAGINACPCAQGLVRGGGGRAAARGRLRGRRRRADPRARPARDAQPARPRHAVRRDRGGGERRAARGRRRGVDERAGVRAAQAARTNCSWSSTHTFSRGSSRTPCATRSRARSRATRRSTTATSCSRARSTSRRSTTTTSSRSASARWASCGASSRAASPPARCARSASTRLAPGQSGQPPRREVSHAGPNAPPRPVALTVRRLHGDIPGCPLAQRLNIAASSLGSRWRTACGCSRGAGHDRDGGRKRHDRTGHDSSSANANTGSDSAPAIDATDT